MDPEEALGGDELEGVVERHDLAAEGSRVAPALPSPPQHLHLVVLSGRAQPGDGPVVEYAAPADTNPGREAWLLGGGDNAEVVYTRPR